MDLLDDKNAAQSASNEQILTNIAIEHLRATAPWMLFAGIVGIVLASIIILYSVIILIQIMPYVSIIGFGTILMLVLTYAGAGGVYLYISILLVQYATKLKQFSESVSSATLELAFNQQRKYWMVYGIILIVFLSLFLITLVTGGGSFKMRL